MQASMGVDRHGLPEKRSEQGRAHRLLQHVEQRHTPFAVSRLIMMCGVQLRKCSAETIEDEATLQRIEAALPTMLTADQARDAIAILRK